MHTKSVIRQLFLYLDHASAVYSSLGWPGVVFVVTGGFMDDAPSTVTTRLHTGLITKSHRS